MQNLKIKEFFIEILSDIFILLGLAVIIIISVPLLVIYGVISLTYKISEFLTVIINKFWVNLLDAFQGWMEALKPDKGDD